MGGGVGEGSGGLGRQGFWQNSKKKMRGGGVGGGVGSGLWGGSWWM